VTALFHVQTAIIISRAASFENEAEFIIALFHVQTAIIISRASKKIKLKRAD